MPTRDLTARIEEALAAEREAHIGTPFCPPCLEFELLGPGLLH